MTRQSSLFGAMTWAMLAAAASSHAAQAAGPTPIRVANHENGSTVRYPVPLLRGTLADAKATSIVVVNLSSKRDTREMKGLAHKGRFKALTELVPGANKLLLRAGKHTLPFTLTYKPQTNSHLVRVVYLTDNTGETTYDTPLKDDPQDYAAKLDTAMKLMQTFTAERLHDIGMGRRTFDLQFGKNGKVKVNVVKADHPAAHFHKMSGHQLYGYSARTVARKLPRGKFKNLVIPAFTRFNRTTRKPMAHTALGGGNQALFGGGDLFTWPSSLADVQRAFSDARRVDPKTIFSDSVGRHTFWANASTTMGAALHEIGHTFGLPHSHHPHDIMTRGHDRLNRVFTLVEPPHARRPKPYEFGENEVAFWAPVSAVMLWPSRWLALDDRPYKAPGKVTFTLDKKRETLSIRCANGIRGVALHKRDAFASYPVPVNAPAPRQLAIPLAWLGRHLRTDSFAIRIRDEEGYFAAAHIKDFLPSPYVQSWRFSSVTQPWRDPKQFPPMTDEKLKAIVASVAKAKLVASKDRFVDFLPRFPASKRAYAAGYVVRTIRAAKPAKVKIHTGSDDALRLWLNGKLIREVLALRSATPDQESTNAQLNAGENTLVAEVSNGIGGWGLYLRLSDARGADLALSKTGELKPFADKSADRIRAILRGGS